MRAVILAAGRGTRLGAASDGLPKCLLQIGGKPLIFHQLECLSDAGVSPVLMVVGYGADLVRETVGARAEYVFNSRYEATNSLASFLLAREWAKGGPLLVLNSDVLFDMEVLERVLKSGAPSIAYDSTSGDGREHMKVTLEAGRIMDMSKEVSSEKAGGENLGLLTLSEKATYLAFAKAQELSDAGAQNAFLAEAIRSTLPEVPFNGVDVAGLPWVEIDSPYDLEHARKSVWPLIQNREGTRAVGYRRRVRRTLIRKVALSLLAAAALFTGGWHFSGVTGPTWALVRPAGAKPTAVEINDTHQEWWLVAPGNTVVVRVSGPQQVRIDIRGVADETDRAERPYVVEVRFNGTRNWEKLTAVVDPAARLAGHTVFDRDKLEVSIPAGEKNLSVRLVAGELKGVLVRVRVPEASQ